MLKIGDGKYRYTDDTIVFSGDKRIQMTDLSDGDTLSVVGRDKNILAVRVTTAQGTLALSNTKLFEEVFAAGHKDFCGNYTGYGDSGAGRNL